MEYYKPPVLFIIFNRPDTTARVFQAIRAYRPTHLYVAADAARNATEAPACAETRAIIQNVDWDCEVKTFFRETNVGCKLGVSGAIDWFFQHESEGIILEDDCLPHADFFQYCAELLTYYRTDPRVLHIGGNNWQYGNKRGNGSYYFSRYPHIWGWATWRRAWQYFDINVSTFPQFKAQGQLANIFPNSKAQRYWYKKLQQAYDGSLKTAWSYQWMYATWVQNGLNICPNVNLVSNIGFGKPGAANTAGLSTRHPMANVPTHPILPFQHPDFFITDLGADAYTFSKIFSPSYLIKARNKFYALLEGK